MPRRWTCAILVVIALIVASTSTAGCAAAPAGRREAQVRPQPAARVEPLPESALTLAVDWAAIRTRAWGPRAGALLATTPEWKQFARGTSLDIARDVERVLVTGPSLRDARQDALVVRYSANDEDVEKAIVSLTSQRVGGGTKTSLVDLGVDGVRGWQMHVGRLDRTFLRGPDHVLVVVPSRQAGAYARELQSGRLTVGPHDGQAAIALRAVKPTTWPFVPAGVIELRARVLLLSDDGTDTFVEADCADAATARIVAKQLEDRFQAAFPAKANGGPAIDTQSEGRTAKAHVRFAKDELESLLDFLGTWSDVEKSQ